MKAKLFLLPVLFLSAAHAQLYSGGARYNNGYGGGVYFNHPDQIYIPPTPVYNPSTIVYQGRNSGGYISHLYYANGNGYVPQTLCTQRWVTTGSVLMPGGHGYGKTLQQTQQLQTFCPNNPWQRHWRW